MDNQNTTPVRSTPPIQTPEEKRAERMKYLKRQRAIRMGAIALAIVLSIISLCVSCSTRRAVSDLAAKLSAKKAAQEQLLAQEASASEEEAPAEVTQLPDGAVSVTLSFIGDVTLSSNEGADYSGSFEEYYRENGKGRISDAVVLTVIFFRTSGRSLRGTI